MKKQFLYLALIILISSCVSSSQVIREEGIFYKTKTYIGVYEQSVVFRDPFVNVQTSKYIITLKENPEIPEGSWCYIRIEPISLDMHPDIKYQLSPKYFTWNGADKEYRIYSDVNEKIFR